MTTKPKYRLTNYEKETIILFNEDEKSANVFTYNKRWQKHIEERMHLLPDEVNTDDGRTYTLPKNTIRLPLIKRTMSPEQKAAFQKKGLGFQKKE